MQSVQFPEAKHKIAETQEEYNTVHAHIGVSPDGTYPVITIKFVLSPEEKKILLETGELWYQQVTHQMRPMSISVVKPELKDR